MEHFLSPPSEAPISLRGVFRFEHSKGTRVDDATVGSGQALVVVEMENQTRDDSKRDALIAHMTHIAQAAGCRIIGCYLKGA